MGSWCGETKQGARKLPDQLVGRIEAAFGLAQDLQRDRGLKLLLQQPLMRGGVVCGHEGLVDLLEFHRRRR
jgi:hypothetical protein